MIHRRTLVLGTVACALTVGAVAVAHRLANASQNPAVVQRFLLGYTDRKGRFIATAGRGATNVPRNSLAMFVFSGNIDAGPNTPVTLPLTLAEQADLQAKIQADPDYDPTHDGYEPGVIPRKRSDAPDARYVATGSVTPFSVIVAAGNELARGQFFKFVKPGTGRAIGNRLLFNPRYAAATFSKPGEVDYNPEALEAFTQYSVFLDGGPSPANPSEVVLNTDGSPLGAQFFTTFTTTDRYVQDFTRPEFRTASPGDASTSVAYDADIDLEFSEPMDISSFVLPRFQGDDQWTVIVRYTQEPKVNGAALAGKNILGTIRIKPQTAGKVVQFRPLQGFGKGPYNIEVVVTNGVTDLSGNNIIRQFQFGFKTESNPDAEDFSQIDEPFGNTSKYDTTTFTPSGDYFDASWNGVVAGRIPGSPTGAKGFLTTTCIEKSFDINGPTPNNSVNIWYHQPVQIQFLFPTSLMGGRARTITGFSWMTGTGFTRTYPGTFVQMGHANDIVEASGFSGTNYSVANYADTPVLVVPSTTYRTGPAVTTGIYVKGPDFSSSFNYSGQRGMILDMTHGGDPAGNAPTPSNWERWRADVAYPIQCATYTINGVQGGANKWLFSTQFRFLTPGAEAQSLLYDIGRSNARTLPQQVVPVTQPQGTSVNFLWQGVREDPVNPNVPDLSTITAWVSDIRQLATYRYIRFRVTLNNNTSTKAAPSVDLLSIPFVYK